MHTLTPARRFFALFALALGGFGIGTTEFVTMGLLPQIAGELLPGFDQNPSEVIAQAGWVITAYALGVVVGAPILAVLGAKMSQRTLVLLLAAAFAVTNLTSALLPTFEATAIARFIAGLPHGAYFGVASLLAARIMGPGRQGAGVALALSGLTVANVIGVPLGTWLGHVSGWRSAYIAVAVIFTATLILGALTLPKVPGDATRDALSEVSALKSRRLWLMLAVGAIGFGGFFAIYSYLAETATRTAGLDEMAVPWLLGTVGVGMTVGNIVGGWASDRSVVRTLVAGFSGFIAVMAAYAMLGGQPVLLFVLAFLIGASGSLLIPSIQSRLIQLSGRAALLGAAMNHAAFNVGNSLGAWLGGLVIAAGFGYLAPGWVGVVLGLIGAVLLWCSVRMDGPSARATPIAEIQTASA